MEIGAQKTGLPIYNGGMEHRRFIHDDQEYEIRQDLSGETATIRVFLKECGGNISYSVDHWDRPIADSLLRMDTLENLANLAEEHVRNGFTLFED